MNGRYDVAIVGGGNLGLWTAYNLAKRGVGRIVVCERAWAGFGATTRSAGVVRQQGGSVTAVRLGKLSRELYRALGDEVGLDSGFVQTGYYVLAETDEEVAAFHDLVPLRQSCGVENEWVDAAEGQRRFPALDWDQFKGGTYTPDDGYVHPPIAARNITFAVAKSETVDLLEMCEVDGIDRISEVYRLRTSRGEIEAERVVAAGGPRGAREIGAMAGVTIPVSATRHHVVTYPALNRELSRPFPMVFALARGYYIRSEEQGAMVGITNPAERADQSGRYQLGFDRAYIDEQRRDWEAVLPALAGQEISRSWAASIDYTPDHLPIIDEAEPGFYVLAAGGHGMMWGPGLGHAMAELMVEGSVENLPDEEIRLARFSAPRAHKDAIALHFPEE